ncbi:MAG: NAD(P)H-dependent oxidoreductase [Sphingomonas sp.]
MTLDTIRHLVILGHPEPGSFNHQVARTYVDTVHACGQHATLRDLYALGFDPRLVATDRPGHGLQKPAPGVAAELEALAGVRVLTLVYPIWFGSAPAMIKGYVDRVLGSGFAERDIKAANPHPLLAGARLVTFSSSATTMPWLSERGQWISLRQAFDHYLADIFAMRETRHYHFDAIVGGLARRFIEERLEETRQRARELCATLEQEREHRAVHRAAWPGER